MSRPSVTPPDPPQVAAARTAPPFPPPGAGRTESPGEGSPRPRLAAVAVVGAIVGAVLVAVVAGLTLGAFLRIVAIAETARDDVVPLVLEQQEQAILAIELARLSEVILGTRQRQERQQALDAAEAVARRIAARAEVRVMGRLDAAVHAVRRSAYRGDVLDALRDSATAHLRRVDELLPPLGGVRGRVEPYATQLLFEIRHTLHRVVDEPELGVIDTLEARFAVLLSEMRELGGAEARATGGRSFALRDLEDFGVVFDLRREQLEVQAQMAEEAVAARDLLAALSNALSADAAAAAMDSAGQIVQHGRAGSSIALTALGVGLAALFLAAWLLLRHVAAPILRAHAALEDVQRGQRLVRLPTARLKELDAVGKSVERLAGLLAEVQVKEYSAKRSQQQLRFIFDVSPVPFLMTQAETSEVIDANEAACALFRTTREALVGRLSRDYWFDPRRRADMVEYLRRVGAVDDFEAHLMTADGHDFWALMSVRLVDLDGASALLIGITDITERKAYEARLQGLVGELEASNRELHAFAAVASHDLREPLRAVTSHLQLLERREGRQLSAEGQEFLRYAVDGARRLQHLIVDLLDYASVGEARSTPKPVALDGVLERARTTHAATFAEAGGRLEVPGPLPTVLGDALTLERLFDNLLHNALTYRAADRPPVVRVEAERVGSLWQIAVADNGRGIAVQDADKVFTMFHRLDGEGGEIASGDMLSTEAPAGEAGTGIGLPICRKIVEQHGGRIWVDAAGGCGPDGAGVALRFTLPAA